MNRKQQRRVEILTQVEAGRLSKREAAPLLGVTRRHVDNLLRRFRQQGIQSVVHGNTGRSPAEGMPVAEFALPPDDPNPAWVPVEEGIDRDYYLSECHTRVVRSDHTLSWMGQTLPLLPLQGHPVRPGDKVTVHHTLEDTLLVYHGKRRLPSKILAAGPSAPQSLSKRKGSGRPPHQTQRRARAHGHRFLPVRSEGSLRYPAPRCVHRGWKKSLSRNTLPFGTLTWVRIVWYTLGENMEASVLLACPRYPPQTAGPVR